MKTKIPSEVNLKRVLTAAFFTLAVLVATHIPQAVIDEKLPCLLGWDKLLHVGAYGLIAALALAAVAVRGKVNFKSWLLVLAVVLTIGALDECTQPLVGRTASIMDWLADLGGVLLALVLVGQVVRYRTKWSPV